MNTRRPVNRVTPKRRTAQTAGPRPVARGPKLASARQTASTAPAERRPRKQPARPPRAPRPERTGASWRLVTLALLGAVVLGGFAVIAAFRPGVSDDNRAYLDSAATEEVRAAGEHALRTIYAYDLDAVDGYEDAVRQVVTGTMLTELDQFAGTTIEAIKQAQTSADAVVDPIGVTMLTDDHAELLVNLVVSATKDGVAQQSVAGPVVLQMTKVDGRWLASSVVDR